ncbi:MAG: fused MFS/spermidine synthase [Alphaproteobacteria bacterium]|nr:fused MFS/spermidine synthase [Alphaproteobacteria bacterium]
MTTRADTLAANASRSAARAFMAVVFLSGFSALAYQIVWERLFVTLFGIDFYCISAITTGFLAGLGLGAHWFGKVADSARVPALRLYAILEIGVGLFGFASLIGIPLLYQPAVALQGWIDNPWLYFLASFGIVFVVTFVPTALMGGTLPVMVKHLYRTVPDTGRAIGAFYAANTFGAVLGALFTVFVLISLFSVDGTIMLAATVNLAIGVYALWRSFAPSVAPVAVAAKAAVDAAPPAALPANTARPLLWLYGISSFLALGYQLVWYRLASLSGWEAMPGLFGWVLGFYLLGIVLGSMAFARIAPFAARWGVGLFATLQFMTAAAGVFGLVAFRSLGLDADGTGYNQLVPIFRDIAERSATGSLWQWSSIADLAMRTGGLGLWSVKFLLLITLPMLIQGICFPLVSRLCLTSYRNSGSDIGWVYLVSIFGSVAGTFLMGFAILPAIGLYAAFLLLTGIGIVGGGVAWWLALRNSNPTHNRHLDRGVVGIAAGTAIAGLVLMLALPSNLYRWVLNKNITTVVEGITGAAYIEEKRLPDGRMEAGIYLNDVRHGAIAPEVDSYDYIMMSTAVSLHPKPERALVIGIGNGTMLTALALHREVRHIDVVEISRELVPALQSRPEFSTIHATINDPRVQIHMADGRMFLNRSEERYDIIATAPFFPWHNYAGYLYSREMFQTIAERLAPGGVFCTLNDHWFSPEMRMGQLRTFAEAFPYYFTITDRQILCGSPNPMRIDRERILQTWALNRDWLANPPSPDSRYDLGYPGAFLKHLRADQTAFPDLSAFPVNRDFDPRSEFWLFQAGKLTPEARALARAPLRRTLSLSAHSVLGADVALDLPGAPPTPQ